MSTQQMSWRYEFVTCEGLDRFVTRIRYMWVTGMPYMWVTWIRSWVTWIRSWVTWIRLWVTWIRSWVTWIRCVKTMCQDNMVNEFVTWLHEFVTCEGLHKFITCELHECGTCELHEFLTVKTICQDVNMSWRYEFVTCEDSINALHVSYMNSLHEFNTWIHYCPDNMSRQYCLDVWRTR